MCTLRLELGPQGKKGEQDLDRRRHLEGQTCEENGRRREGWGLEQSCNKSNYLLNLHNKINASKRIKFLLAGIHGHQ